MSDDLSYRSIGSIVQADLENAGFVRFYCCRIGIEYGSFSFGARSEAGIGNTSELGYVNSIGKELKANGRFNIGEDMRWTSFSKTFDLMG